MKNFLKKTWMWLNGNKTIIGLGLLYVLDLNGVKSHINPQVLPLLNLGIGLLTGLSGYDHFRKGFFSTKGGNPGQVITTKKTPYDTIN